MRPPAAALAALLALSAPAARGEDLGGAPVPRFEAGKGAGGAAAGKPRSPEASRPKQARKGWLPSSPAAGQRRLQDLADEIAVHAKPVAQGAKVVYRPGWSLRGAVGNAFSPNTDSNPGDYGRIEFDDDVFYLAHDDDELAFMVAHELAHIELGHAEQAVALRETLLKSWVRGLPRPELLSLLDSGRACKAGKNPGACDEMKRAEEDGISDRLDERWRLFERQADARGRELMAKANFMPGAAIVVLSRIADMTMDDNYWLFMFGGQRHDADMARAEAIVDAIAGAP